MSQFTFYKDPKYVGKHFLLSPSSHRLDKDRTPDELLKFMRADYAKDIGTAIHALAAESIEYRIKADEQSAYNDIQRCLLKARIPRAIIDPYEFLDTYILYVNDAILYEMTPEVPLVYSSRAGGTTDAISFNPRKKLLRIHDLKTGSTPAKMDQLSEYAAYFCLCYKKKPMDLNYELRIYQSGEAIIAKPDPDYILHIADRIVSLSDYLINTYE